MSELQQRLNEAVVNAFDFLGGDPADAIKSANGKSVKQWVMQQQRQVAVTGAVSNLVPFASLPALTADLAILMGKMAYTCWGIGAIRGCKVFGKADFVNIMDLWTGTTLSGLEYVAVTSAFYNHVEQFKADKDLWDGLDPDSFDVYDSLVICNEIYKTVITDQKLYAAFKSLGADKAAWSARDRAKVGANYVVLLKSLSNKVARRVGTKIGGKIVSKLSSRVATRMATKIGTRIATKAATNIVPILGATVGGALNYFFIGDLAKSADIYYSNPIDLGKAPPPVEDDSGPTGDDEQEL